MVVPGFGGGWRFGGVPRAARAGVGVWRGVGAPAPRGCAWCAWCAGVGFGHAVRVQHGWVSRGARGSHTPVPPAGVCGGGARRSSASVTPVTGALLCGPCPRPVMELSRASPSRVTTGGACRVCRVVVGDPRPSWDCTLMTLPSVTCVYPRPGLPRLSAWFSRSPTRLSRPLARIAAPTTPANTRYHP